MNKELVQGNKKTLWFVKSLSVPSVLKEKVVLCSLYQTRTMIVPLTSKEGMELPLRILVLLVVIQEDGVGSVSCSAGTLRKT